MSTSTSTPIADPPQLGFFERLGVWASWGMGGWIFLTAGWLIMRPADPLGPVSLFSGQSGLVVVVLVAALSGVTAALATVIGFSSIPIMYVLYMARTERHSPYCLWSGWRFDGEHRFITGSPVRRSPTAGSS